MTHTITFPGRMTDQGYSWPITLTAPEGWKPLGYHVTTCERCGQVTEPYSTTDPRVVHRDTGWVMCSPSRTRGQTLAGRRTR